MAICDNQTYFSRDVKVFIEIGTDVWEIPVLDGFSFTQGNNSSEVSLSEMESSTGTSRRGKKVFNDSLAPAEWSFSTYVRPFVSTFGIGGGQADSTAANVHAVEEALWGLLAGKALRNVDTFWDGTTDYYVLGVANTGSVFDFETSNVSVLGTANIYFVLKSSGLTYKITEAAVNEATVNFDIDGIATIEWSGMGANLVESVEPTRTIYEGITDTDNFIRNRLTSMTVAPVKTGDATGTYSVAEEGTMENSYNITLTGGSITVSNNISYITPEELGIVNIPIGHVTGMRSVSGSFTAYLTLDSTSINTDLTADFWEDLRGLSTVVTHDFALEFQIGGSSGSPRLELAMPHAHVEIPTHSVEDVISLETTFTGLGTCINAADELTVKYFVAA